VRCSPPSRRGSEPYGTKIMLTRPSNIAATQALGLPAGACVTAMIATYDMCYFRVTILTMPMKACGIPVIGSGKKHISA
jgi:hypothetical protein